MKKITFLLISAAVLTAAILIVPKREPTHKVPDSDPVAASNVAERMYYFASHGWEVEEIAGKDITVPSDFSAVYEDYASLQDKQGMPLREYAGRDARLYVYEVKNYSPGSNKMLAELLVCDNTAIASMVYSEDGGSLRLAVS